jgi:hypothetical protein
MKHGVTLGILFVVAIFGALILLGQAAASPRLGGEVCQCWHINECRYENHGFGEFVGYNYHTCGGSCAFYGRGWVKDSRCVYPEKTPRHANV